MSGDYLSQQAGNEPHKANSVKEGQASIIYPPHVFYNPVQEFNRDITIAVIKKFAQDYCSEKIGDVSSDCAVGQRKIGGIKILEGLAASGLRSVRFALEIPGIESIIANDYDKSAVEFIKKNVELNGVQELVQPSCSDVTMLMHQTRARREDLFDVIDLDPYGSPSQFLDSAVQVLYPA